MDIRQVLEERSIRSESDSEQLSADCAYELLGNARRLIVVELLLERSDVIPVEELVGEIVTREQQEINGTADPDALQKSVYASLHQTHLPQLADNGVITYDRNQRKVMLTDRGRQLRWFLHPEAERPADTAWALGYFAVSLGTALFLTVIAIGWLPLSVQVPVLCGGILMLTAGAIQRLGFQ